jgi:hypothetical protein
MIRENKGGEINSTDSIDGKFTQKEKGKRPRPLPFFQREL